MKLIQIEKIRQNFKIIKNCNFQNLNCQLEGGGGRNKIVKFCIPVLYYQLCTLYMHLLAWVNCTAGYSEVLAVQYLHLCTVSTSYHILASNLLNVHCKYLIILEVPYLFARGWECFFTMHDEHALQPKIRTLPNKQLAAFCEFFLLFL